MLAIRLLITGIFAKMRHLFNSTHALPRHLTLLQLAHSKNSLAKSAKLTPSGNLKGFKSVRSLLRLANVLL